MAKFAKGKHALAISDRSGLAFPWREMVTEWNGQFVHYSEFERKQPQLEPRPFVADPQGLQKARPQVAPLPTPDLLPENPFFLPNGIPGVIEVNHPDSGIQVGDQVRLMSVKQNIPVPSPFNNIVSIQDLEMSTTLAADITATDTTLTTTDFLPTFTTGGFLVIEKINPTTGFFENEVIQFTSRDILPGFTYSGLIRGTNAPFRGETPINTTASAHSAGAKVFGSREVLSLNTTTSASAGQPSTVTNFNGYNLNFTASSVYASLVGGGLNCLAGPVNNNFTSTNL